MIQNVVASIILYSGTAVDLLIILMLFFAKRKSRKDIINIYLGQFLGSVSLILLSLLFAFVLDYIPSKEILGLLGLIPIFLGLKVLLLGDSDGEAIAKEGLSKDNKNLIFLVDMITFACGGADNWCLCPIFYDLKFSEFDSGFTYLSSHDLSLGFFCPKIGTSPFCWRNFGKI